jgi:hypothetical protein
MKNYLHALAILSTQAMHLQDSEILHDVITHATYKAATFPAYAHVITVPLNEVEISLVPAIGQRETVSALARAGATIAVNGSNYRRGGNYNGNRVNLFYLDGKIYSDLQLTRGAFCWNSTIKTPAIDTVFLDIQLSIGHIPLSVTAVNQPRVTSQAVLYTDVADIALLAYTPGKNIVINKERKVESISSAIPKTIPDGYLVYQIDTDALPEISLGMPVNYEFTLRSAETEATYNGCDFVLAGAGLLLKNGNLVADELYQEFSQGAPIVHCGDEIAADFITRKMQEWLIELRHPRTAIGITEYNEICIVTVDGRQEHSQGLSLKELAIFMQQLGCIDALNIGGGGCTTLCIDGKRINSPSAGQERPVSEALCLHILRNS